MYDPDQEETITASTLRVRSKITKGTRGGYAVEQTIELACPIHHWVRERVSGLALPVVAVGFNEDGEEVTKPYEQLYESALTQAGRSLMDEVKRRQQADGGLRITEDE